jgi:phenylalanyl-tRNA synthetase beta chain
MLREKLDLRVEIYLLEMNITKIEERVDFLSKFSEIGKFPGVERDLAIVVDEGVKAGEIYEAMKRAGGENVESIRLFDLYRGEQVPSGKKSLAYSIRYRSAEKTLTEEEVQDFQKSILASLKEKFGATLR